MTEVLIENPSYDFKAVKKDAESGDPLAGAKFALYRQIEGANGPRKDYVPIFGYSSITSKSNGVIEGIDENLAPGTYYLTEKEAPRGYSKLNEDICFTISKTGHIHVSTGGFENAVSKTENGAGKVHYVMNVENSIEALVVPSGFSEQKTPYFIFIILAALLLAAVAAISAYFLYRPKSKHSGEDM